MFAAPDTTVPMVFIIFIARFKMIAIIQRFRNKVPLQCSAIAIINRKGFIGTPAYRAMIDDNVISPGSAKSVIASIAIDHTALLILIAHAKPQVADNDIITGQ